VSTSNFFLHILGKTVEDQMNYKDFYVVTNQKDFVKLVRKPHLQNAYMLDENLMIVEMRKTNIMLTRPRYVGQTILDDAKVILGLFFL